MSSAYFLALGFTVALEVPVVAALFPGQRLRLATACAIATTCTHLAMHHLLPLAVPTADQVGLYGELGALAAEGLVYALVSRPRDYGRALVATALANGLSYGVGLLIFAR